MTTQSNGSSEVIQGRLIWTLGTDLFAGKQKVDMTTKQPVIGNDGNPVIEYGFGLAIPKLNPQTGQPTEEYQKIWNIMQKEALTIYPDGNIPPLFAWKYKDGDGVDHNGKPFADREGYAGHFVVSCTTRIPIKYFIFQGGNNVLVNTGIKCGDYVNAQLNIKAHPAQGTAKPGLYVNPNSVQLIQPGKEIINSPSGDQIFGQNAPGYNGQVVAPEVGAMPNTHQPAHNPAAMSGMGQQPAMTPQEQQAAAIMPNTHNPAAAPNYNVLPQTHQPAHNPAAMPGMPANGQALNVPNGVPPQTQANPGMPNMPGMP